MFYCNMPEKRKYEGADVNQQQYHSFETACPILIFTGFIVLGLGMIFHSQADTFAKVLAVVVTVWGFWLVDYVWDKLR